MRCWDGGKVFPFDKPATRKAEQLAEGGTMDGFRRIGNAASRDDDVAPKRSLSYRTTE